MNVRDRYNDIVRVIRGAKIKVAKNENPNAWIVLWEDEDGLSFGKSASELHVAKYKTAKGKAKFVFTKDVGGYTVFADAKCSDSFIKGVLVTESLRLMNFTPANTGESPYEITTRSHA